MNLRGDKQGSEKYYIIISLILGIMVLALVLYFIFNEYFTDETLDLESCRQSIVLRGTIPEDYTGDIKAKFPLKCQTQLVLIKDSDKAEASKKISESAASSFFVSGERNVELFPKVAFVVDRNCLVLSRISFSESVKEDFKKDKINLWEYFKTTEFINKKTYLDYFYSGFVEHPFIKKDCEGLKIDDDYFKNKRGIPTEVNPDKDIFVFMVFTSKGYSFVDKIPSGFAKWDCSTTITPTTFYDEYPSIKEFYITQDENLITSMCDSYETIPA